MTDMQVSAGAFLKTDTQGRVQTPAAQRERLLDEFDKSGLSATKFAALVGVKYQTFAGWVARRRKHTGAKAPAEVADPVRWLEAERTFAWLYKWRRLRCDYEQQVRYSQALIQVAAIGIMLNRLTRA